VYLLLKMLLLLLHPRPAHQDHFAVRLQTTNTEGFSRHCCCFHCYLASAAAAKLLLLLLPPLLLHACLSHQNQVCVQALEPL
jgi:hypothetical protein